MKHVGDASNQWESGHYYSYVRREEDNLWWKHEDAFQPTLIGLDFSSPSDHIYSQNCTDMMGITGILFRKY